MKRFLICLVAVSILLCSALSASAATLKTFKASHDWKVFVWKSADENTDKTKIIDENGYTIAGNFTMCDDLLIGTYDFSKGMPTKFTIEYADGTDYGDGLQSGVFYVVIDSNMDGDNKWWSGEFNTEGTGSYDTYKTQTFELLGGKWGYGYGGGDQTLPTGVKNIYLELSTFFGNIKSVTFSNDEAETSKPDNKNPGTGDMGIVIAFLAATVGSGSIVLAKKRNRK